MHTQISRNLRFLRKKRGLSQAALADKLGLNRGNIASYEKGIAEPNLSNLLNMVRFFEVDVIGFIDRDLSSGQGEAEGQGRPGYLSNSSMLTFNREANQLEAIIAGQRQYYQRKLKAVEQAEETHQNISQEYERLLEIAEELMQLNRRLLSELEARA